MNENALTKYQKYVRPELGKVLSALKLDNVYEQAAGDQMMTTLNGQHASVSDFLGGFGSTILGHNHPVVIEALKQCQEGKKPQHAQGSLKKETALLAEKLNHITKLKLNESRDYVVTFANSGTEAVEVALKHALLEWNEKRERTIFRIRTQFFARKMFRKKWRR